MSDGVGPNVSRLRTWMRCCSIGSLTSKRSAARPGTAVSSSADTARHPVRFIGCPLLNGQITPGSVASVVNAAIELEARLNTNHEASGGSQRGSGEEAGEVDHI